MTSQFSQKVTQILDFSRTEAERLGATNVTPELLLLALLREKGGVTTSLLHDLDIDPATVKQELESEIRNSAPQFSQPGIEIQLTPHASNILRLAILEARMQATPTVDPEHLLLALLHDKVDNGAKKILENNDMTYDNTLAMLRMKTSDAPKNGIGMPEEEDDDMTLNDNGDKQKQAATAHAKQPNGKTPMLDNFGTDLTHAAEEGLLDPVVGREREIQRVVEILCRRKKNNPVLIGEPGVGKSAIVEGLAQLIAKRHTSPMLFGKRVITLDLTGIVAGTKYRGQFEERVRALIKEIEQNPNVIIFIDEIHTLVGAGSTPGSMDAANIMKPALARGVIQCIGATTLSEYRNSIEKDGALERRFQKVLVEPTTADETVEILQNIKERYEKHHHVSYSADAIKACVEYTKRYITDRFFPDKAIDALDETGSKIHLRHAQVPPEITDKEKEIRETTLKKQMAVKNQNFELAAGFRDRETQLKAELEQLQEKFNNGSFDDVAEVTESDVAEVVSMMSGVPVQRMSQTENERLRGMAQRLKDCVVAQDSAIDKTVKAIQRNRLGLRDPKHPIGAFMFLGPTGVGKTYLAKKLAEEMFGSADALIRIDMSEYSESFNTSRLVGAPPGYVGYDEGGQLTEKVRRHPYSIVLLDEIEKAHGNVFNMLLQVLDEGRLTDGSGRMVDFSNTVIIMTSNAGTRQLKDFGRGVGFTAGGTGNILDDADRQHARSIVQKSLSKQFSPEFLNRLDEIITFDQLSLDAIKSIIDIELKGLLGRMQAMGHPLEITSEAKEFVATKGYDVQYGARPLKRAIQTYIEDGVCQLLLEDTLTDGTPIAVGKNPDKEELTFEPK